MPENDVASSIGQIANLDEIELQNRMQAVQQQVTMNNFSFSSAMPKEVPTNRPSVVLPIWISGELFVLRTCESTGCELKVAWIDWLALRESLIADVADLVSDVELIASDGDGLPQPENLLAALPLRLVVPPPAIATSISSPTLTALGMAWAAWASRSG